MFHVPGFIDAHHRPSYRLKTSSIKVTILKTKSAIIAFCLFSSSPFSSQLWGKRFVFFSCGISRHTVAYLLGGIVHYCSPVPASSVSRDERKAFSTWCPGGGGTAIYGLYRYVPLLGRLPPYEKTPVIAVK